ncbi:uncharacterized protein LOC143460474 [Clavelina lepadiformis]|uniref:uncharacterized protein LOC143460474 n=1 Tax=Clavelina lepadiformis TaxID=159417 RepID=UPI004041426B
MSCLSYKMLCLTVLFFCAVAAQFQLDEIPSPTPKFCLKMPEKGPCRATHRRYRYNATSDQCELFTWGGCADENSQNMFRTTKDCESKCKRDPVHRNAFKSSFFKCEFQANIGRECALDSFEDFKHIRECIDIPDNSLNRSQCQSRGCCWHPEYQVCYQKESGFVESMCSIRYASNEGFWGKIIFKSDGHYPADWVGLLKFNIPVRGGFCILRDRFRSSGIGLSTETFEDRTKFLLPAMRPLSPGDNVVVMFAGGFQASTFSKNSCEYVNLPPY